VAPDTSTPRFARDAAATRRRILDAATAEFSALGLSGARTARIAESAEANQRMIYAYFGNKDGLFDAVLEHNIVLIQTAVTFDVEDLPGYAQHIFDFYRANPHLVRLELWQTLERPNAIRSMPLIKSALAHKVAALEQAQAAGLVSAVLPPGQLLDHILTLAHGHPMHAGDAASWTDEQRHALATGVAALTGQPPNDGGTT
jgi:AcrR family transcriptional regulator